MASTTIRKRKIVFESKTRQVAIIIFCLVFIISDLYTKSLTDEDFYWITLFFFGGLTIYITLRLINPANDFVSKNSMRGMYLLENEYSIVKEEIGVFHYFEEGFSIEHANQTARINWNEIDTLIAYKENRNIVDEICLDFFSKDKKVISISESIPGWFQFIKRLPPRYSSISADWYETMADNAASPMISILFDRGKRNRNQLLKICFPNQNYYSMFKDTDGI